MKRRFRPTCPLVCLCCAILLICLSPAGIGETVLTEQGIDLGTASVHWPALAGMEDTEAQSALNRAIRQACRAEDYTARVAAVMDADPPLTLTWEGGLSPDGGLLSCAMLAEGPLESERIRSVWYTVNLDLNTGEPFTLGDLFTDADEAFDRIGEYLEEEILPEMSAHLMNCALTPLPDGFRVGPEGLTLYYPFSQLSTLSDRAGAVTLSWGEIPEDLLNLSEGSICDRLGVMRRLGGDADALTETLAGGGLPGLPCTLGDGMEALVSQYRLLCDPDLYDGGRYIQLEDSRFRQVYLMTDALREKGFNGSTLNGIRCDRFALYGLITGRTERAEALEMLGEPYATVTLDAEAAEAMRLTEGTSDYYRCGDIRLRLHYDSGDILASLFLLP